MYAEKSLLAVVVIVKQTMPVHEVIHAYAKVVLSRVNLVHFHKVNFPIDFLSCSDVLIQLLSFSLACPIKDCGTKGICVETDGIILKPGGKPIYYVCSCQDGYITYQDCDSKIF